MKKNQVTKTKFLIWYFRNSDDIESMGYEVYQCLKFDDEYHITVQDLFNECVSIPNWICEGEFDKEGDIDKDNVELING